MTAEELLKTIYNEGSGAGGDSYNEGDIERIMIKFAKLHVENALIEASNIADYGIYQNDDGQEPFHHESNIFINKDAILNSYDLENIK